MYLRLLKLGLVAMLGVEISRTTPTNEASISPSAIPTLRAAAEVIVVRDPMAVEGFCIKAERLQPMVECGLERLSAQRVNALWKHWLKPDDNVGIKVYSSPGPIVGTRVEVVEALIKSLISAGIDAKKIILWDRYRRDLIAAGFDRLATRYGIRIEGAMDAGYDPDIFYDNPIPGTLMWGDLEFRPGEFRQGRRSYVTRLLTKQINRLIHIVPLLNQNEAGVTGILFSFAIGAVDNTARFLKSREILATAVPEILALPALRQIPGIYIVDALIAQYYGDGSTRLHDAIPLGELWFGKDPVALDVLAAQRIQALQKKYGTSFVEPVWSLYSNAELLGLGTADPKKVAVLTVEVSSASH